MGSVDTWVGYWGRLHPARPAIAVGARILTWGSLAARSGRLAAGLAAESAGRGRRIGGMDEPLLMLHTRGTTTGVPRVAAAPAVVASALGALHAGALIRFGDLAELLDDDDQPRPTVLVTTCEQLERPGLTARLAAVSDPPEPGGPRLVKAPGPVREALRRECRSRAIPFGEMFGLAESGGLILQRSPFREPADGLVPLLGQQARVVDAAGATAPAGQPGELVLAGSAVTGDGWLRTGDLAVEAPDGSLTILGRQQ